MEYDDYISKLEPLNFTIEKKYLSSIYLVDKLSKYIEQEESPYIIIALDKAIEFDADAVYFRFFDDGRPPIAQIYIYDNIQKNRTSDEYNKIHKAIWSGCEIPIYMIINKTEIKLFDGRKNFNIHNNEIESQYVDMINLNFDIQNDILKKYNAQLFNNGTFWETDIANKHFLNDTGAAERLLKSLKEVRDRFKRHIKKQPELSDRLLIMCILIKYLEENGIDPETNENLASIFFQRSTGFNTLKDVLYNNKLTCLLKALSDHFNGGIFSMIDRRNPDKEIYSDIDKIDQKRLAVFFDAGSSENLFGWSDYSFEHIPVELISNLYEEFLPKEKNKQGKDKDTPKNGAVYTPSFLVNFLIDECLPLGFNDVCENIKLLDPACGSGIFLVTAYKRLIQRWRIKNIKDNKLADPEPDTLKQILKNNIFGIDIHYNSVHLTVFSLQLALCSMLKPKQIWTKKRLFNDLEKEGNVIEKDFFYYISDNKISQDFDLIIGNPPFKELPKKEFLTYKEKLNKFNINLQIPRYQEALLFLSASFILLKKETGKLCLIQKSGPFLYSEDEGHEEKLSFRMALFKQFNVSQIIDFSLIKKDLFKANVETIAVFIDNKLPENDSISHIVIRKTRSVTEKSYFELCHYDFHEIPSHIAVSKPYAWKCNLFCGTQLYNLINRLKEFQNLKDYLDIKKSEGWDYGQGYIVGNKKNKDQNKVINGNCTVIDKYFKDDGIKKTEIQKETHFKDIPANAKLIFSPPHLIIKKTIGKNLIPIELRDDYLTFKNEILGIHCPKKQRDDLVKLEKQLRNNNDILRLYIAVTSARSGINRSIFTSELCDLLNIPLFFKKSFNPSNTEKIIIYDILNYYIEEIRVGDNSAIHKKTADKDKHIKPFSKIYCDSLNKIYAKDDGRKYYFSMLTEGCSFYICEYTFGIGNNYNYNKTDDNLDDLLISWNSNYSVKYNKIMRIYGKNIIRLVKPKKLLFWLQSTALRDFDDTLEDALKREEICKNQ